MGKYDPPPTLAQKQGELGRGGLKSLNNASPRDRSGLLGCINSDSKLTFKIEVNRVQFFLALAEFQL